MFRTTALLLLAAGGPAAAGPPAGAPTPVSDLPLYADALALGPDGSALVTYGGGRQPADPVADLIDLKTGTGRAAAGFGVRRGLGPNPVAVSPDGRYAVCVTRPNGIDLLDLAAGTAPARLNVSVRGGYHDDAPSVVAVGDRVWAWSVGVPDQLRAYRLDGTALAAARLDPLDAVFAVAPSPDGKRAYALGLTGKAGPVRQRFFLAVVDAAAGVVLRRHDLVERAFLTPAADAVAVSRDGSTVAVVCPDGAGFARLRLYTPAGLDAESPAAKEVELPSVYAHKAGVALSPDGGTVAVFSRGAAGWTARTDPTRTDRLIEQLRIHPGRMHLFDVAKLDAAGAFDPAVARPDLSGAVRGFDFTPAAAAYAPDGTLYVASFKQVLKLAAPK